MRSIVKKTVAAALAAVTLAVAVAGSATPAQAWYRHYGYGYGYGHGWGPVAAAGVFGLAAGAILATQAGAYPYAPGSCWVSQPVYDGWGHVVAWRRAYAC